MSNTPQRVPAGQPQGSPELLNELQSEVSTEAAPLLQFILKHAGVIVAALVLFVVVLAGTAGYNWYAERNRQQAQKDLTRVVLTTQGADRLAALEKFMASAPNSIKTAGLLAVADAAMEQKAYAKAAQSFGNLVAVDPKGAVGLLAALNQGQALILAGQAKEAVTVLQTLESLMPEAQRNVARQALAEAALQSDDKALAKKVFESMAKSVSGPEADFYRYRASMLDSTTPASK